MLPALSQHRVSEPAASHFQAEEPCAPVWKARRVAFRLPSLGSQKKGEKVSLFSFGLHLAVAF